VWHTSIICSLHRVHEVEAHREFISAHWHVSSLKRLNKFPRC